MNPPTSIATFGNPRDAVCVSGGLENGEFLGNAAGSSSSFWEDCTRFSNFAEDSPSGSSCVRGRLLRGSSKLRLSPHQFNRVSKRNYFGDRHLLAGPASSTGDWFGFLGKPANLIYPEASWVFSNPITS